MNVRRNWHWHSVIYYSKEVGEDMVVEKVLYNIEEKSTEKRTITIPFQWFELEKKRIAKVASDGTEVGVAVNQVLRHGDVVAETESSLYVVELEPTALIKIHVHSMQEMGRVGFELGNRHLSLKIDEDSVWVPYDEPTFEYLKKLGFDVSAVTEMFADYIQCKAHGHSHGHHH